VAAHYRVPVMGLANTLHETVYTARGVELIPEFFADLDYDGKGRLIITREHRHVDADAAAQKALRAVRDGVVRSVEGSDVSVRAKTVRIHSDTPNAVEIVRAVHGALFA